MASTIKTKILDSPSLNIIIGAVLVSLIVACFVLSVTLLTAFSLTIIVYWGFRFVTRQMDILRQFTVDYVNRISDKIIQLIIHR